MIVKNHMKKKMKRIKTKGHYRIVERDEKGKFVKVEKWSSKRKLRYDPFRDVFYLIHK